VKISSYWSQGIYVSNFVENELPTAEHTLLTAGTIGLVVGKAKHKGDQLLLVLFNEQIFSFAVNRTSNAVGYWGSANIVECVLEKVK